MNYHICGKISAEVLLLIWCPGTSVSVAYIHDHNL